MLYQSFHTNLTREEADDLIAQANREEQVVKHLTTTVVPLTEKEHLVFYTIVLGDE